MDTDYSERDNPKWDVLALECEKFLAHNSKTVLSESEIVECIIKSGAHEGDDMYWWRPYLDTRDFVFGKSGIEIVPFEISGGFVYGIRKNGKFISH